jgi:hypothetical protein
MQLPQATTAFDTRCFDSSEISCSVDRIPSKTKIIGIKPAAFSSSPRMTKFTSLLHQLCEGDGACFTAVSYLEQPANNSVVARSCQVFQS